MLHLARAVNRLCCWPRAVQIGASPASCLAARPWVSLRDAIRERQVRLQPRQSKEIHFVPVEPSRAITAAKYLNHLYETAYVTLESGPQQKTVPSHRGVPATGVPSFEIAGPVCGKAQRARRLASGTAAARAAQSFPTLSTAKKASCGMSTRPTRFMRRLPSRCRSSSLRFRVISPP